MCEHLQPLEKYLKEKGINETFRGQPWSDNCREWIHFDCVLNTESLKTKFHLPSFVATHENTDPKSGTESGLVCTLCKDGIIGVHTDDNLASKKLLVD